MGNFFKNENRIVGKIIKLVQIDRRNFFRKNAAVYAYGPPVSTDLHLVRISNLIKDVHA